MQTTTISRWPLFIFLLPGFFLLHQYNAVFGFLSFPEIFWPVIVVYTSTIVLWLMARLPVKDKTRADLIAALLLGLLLFFPALQELLHGTVFGKYSVALPLALILVSWLMIRIIRRPQPPPRLPQYLNITFSLLVAYELVLFAGNAVRVEKRGNTIFNDHTLCDSISSIQGSPDIYFILVDEYTSSEWLGSRWHFDNRPIEMWLENRNFFLPAHARSNYDFTPFSVASMLNMTYLPAGSGHDATEAKPILQAMDALYDNNLTCLLAKAGYDFFFLAPFSRHGQPDKFTGQFNYLRRNAFYTKTLPGAVLRDIAWNFRKWFTVQDPDPLVTIPPFWLKKIKFNKQIIDSTRTIAIDTGSRRPRMVYTHLMIIHEPHIFDSTGQYAPELMNHPLPDTYIQGIQYTNLVIKDLVSAIQSNTKRQSIILIQGDHGFRSFPDSSPGEHFASFSAVYFPDQQYSRWYDGMSTVNNFRLVLNQYFGQHLPLLKDSSVLVKQ